ncbi:hypothetical protein H4582DRAFT_2084789 [Lactarius indigo]|nr:hypothetical protein H4582DRAFT_2092337 [Lactarius indigo]KAI9428768.1 hypothetical protein H4582DRAFT_2159842 [Lactarius indigo]KAI9429708.1 hypothetical protein H4582DRAFT_2088584 [Lactarius indigo]KAI9431610.1 hypothetical protein H4582DRAFT_2084789 [Lactarius indigo]
MSLVIVLGELYRAKRSKRKRAVTKNRINAHFLRNRGWLEKMGVKVATVRNIGWHGESGAAGSGGHLTVDFTREDGSHVTTHHIYPTDEAYGDEVLGEGDTRQPHLTLATYPSLPPASPSSPLHRVIVAVVIGVARFALAVSSGSGSDIPVGVMLRFHAERLRAATPGNPTKGRKG